MFKATEEPIQCMFLTRTQIESSRISIVTNVLDFGTIVIGRPRT